MPPWLLLASVGAALYAAGAALNSRIRGWAHPRRRRQRHGRPLVQVVAACEASWFLEELQLAMGGSEEAMVRVGHMLLVGYGAKQDPQEAAKWLRRVWAIQNLKEPGDRALAVEALDPEASAIPALNERGRSPHGRRRQHTSPPTGPAPVDSAHEARRSAAAAAAAAACGAGRRLGGTDAAAGGAPQNGGCSSSGGGGGGRARGADAPQGRGAAASSRSVADRGGEGEAAPADPAPLGAGVSAQGGVGAPLTSEASPPPSRRRLGVDAGGPTPWEHPQQLGHTGPAPRLRSQQRPVADAALALGGALLPLLLPDDLQAWAAPARHADGCAL